MQARKYYIKQPVAAPTGDASDPPSGKYKIICNQVWLSPWRFRLLALQRTLCVAQCITSVAASKEILFATLPLMYLGSCHMISPPSMVLLACCNATSELPCVGRSISQAHTHCYCTSVDSADGHSVLFCESAPWDGVDVLVPCAQLTGDNKGAMWVEDGYLEFYNTRVRGRVRAPETPDAGEGQWAWYLVDGAPKLQVHVKDPSLLMGLKCLTRVRDSGSWYLVDGARSNPDQRPHLPCPRRLTRTRASGPGT